MKNKILFACILAAQSHVSLHAEFLLDEVNREEYTQHYNLLPSVEENNYALKNNVNFPSFLEKAQEVVTLYELEPYVGVRLIHKHFPVDHNQLMLEEYKLINSASSLVTSAHDFDMAIEKEAFPASWIFSNSSTRPFVFEASVDPAVRIGIRRLQENYEFMGEIESLLRKNNLQGLLSIALLRRDSLHAQGDNIYMEINDGNSAQSVVQLWPENSDLNNSIRTSWSFKGPKQVGCINVSYCSKQSDGSHVTYSFHKSS